MLILLFFFFKAEDGIRDRTVTGVQTCALPISHARAEREQVRRLLDPREPRLAEHLRSEERRVGKECRSRGAPYHDKKKTYAYQHFGPASAAPKPDRRPLRGEDDD